MPPLTLSLANTYKSTPEKVKTYAFHCDLRERTRKKNMRLTFELEGHREFSFQVVVRDETTLSQLKQMLSKVTMLAAESHTLHFNGVVMNHEELELRAYEIQDEGTLLLMLPLEDSMLTMALYVIHTRIAALHQVRLTVIPSLSDGKITFSSSIWLCNKLSLCL